MKRNYLPGPIIDVEGIVSVSKGGTDADNAPQALANLGFVAISETGKPLGPIPIDEITGLISNNYFNNLFSSSVEIEGKKILDPNEIATYLITNFDSRLSYIVTADQGVATISGSTITYVAPNSLNASIGFSVNGVMFPLVLTLSEKIPNTPTIISPAANYSGTNTSVAFISSNWSSSYTDDFHYSSDWQVATDAGFLDIVSEALDVTSQRTSFSLANAISGNSYYTRVRYKGGFGSYSEWSVTRTFICLENLQKVETPVIIYPNSNGDLNSNTITFDTSDFSSLMAGDTHFQTEWSVSLNASFGVDTTSIISSDVNLKTLTRTLVESQFLYARVRFIGSVGVTSEWSATRTVRYIALVVNNQPVIVYPSTNTTVGVTNPDIRLSDFVSTGSPAEFIEYQYATNLLFTQNLVTRTDSTDGTPINTHFNNLQMGTTYYFRARYKAVDGTYTPWSLERIISLAIPAKPSIISPALNETDVSLNTNILSSSFAMVGQPSTHLNSDWIFSLSDTFNVIEHSSYNNKTDLTIYPRVNLEVNKVYYVKTRHRSISGFTSEWSDVVSFTTIVNKFVSKEIAFINSIEVDYPNLLTMSSSGDRLSVSRSTDATIYRITSSGLVAELVVNNSHLGEGTRGSTTASAGRGYLSMNRQGTKAVHILICNPNSYSGTSLHPYGDIIINSYTRDVTSTVWTSESAYKANLDSFNLYPRTRTSHDTRDFITGRYETNRYLSFRSDGVWEFYFSFMITGEAGVKTIVDYIAESYWDQGFQKIRNQEPGTIVLNFDRCNFRNFTNVTNLAISADPIVSTGVTTAAGITLGTSKISVTEQGGTKTEICTITGLDLNKDTPFIPRYVVASADCKTFAYYDKTRKGVVVLK